TVRATVRAERVEQHGRQLARRHPERNGLSAIWTVENVHGKVGAKKKDLHAVGVSPFTGACCQCRREDSNLHTLYGYQVLNLARLPIPPLRQAEPVPASLLLPMRRCRQAST